MKFLRCNTWSDVTVPVPAKCCLPSPQLWSFQSSRFWLLCTPLIAVIRILHQGRGSPKTPPEGQCLYYSYRHAHQQKALGWAVTSTQWVYIYGFCTTQLWTVRLRNMAELGKGNMWTRKIRATCTQADTKRSTEHSMDFDNAAGPPHPVFLQLLWPAP